MSAKVITSALVNAAMMPWVRAAVRSCAEPGIAADSASHHPHQELPDGGTRVAYDSVASQIAPHHDAAASQVAQRLDTEVLTLLA
ncbi:MAG TPA: hypothetical protein VGC06_16695 [Actinomycetes bacterium]